LVILGIETSCDETAVAVLKWPRTTASGAGTLCSPPSNPSHLPHHDAEDPGAVQHPVSLKDKEVTHLLSSQIDLHKQYGGIVPELACRRHMEMLAPLVKEVLRTASCTFSELDAVAVTIGPGLIGALLVGVSFAKSLAFGLGVPLLAVHHLEGHIAAVFLEHDAILYPAIALVVSGGHTNLYRVNAPGSYQILGKTRDDAAGEAFDKGARMLGLEYPGGPMIDHLAKEGDSTRFPFPFPLQEGLDFSFSGLKSALMRTLAGAAYPARDGHLSQQDNRRFIHPGHSAQETESSRQERSTFLSDIAASYQKAIVTSLIQKTLSAVKQVNAKSIIIVGGVAANSQLRHRMKEEAQRHRLALYIPSLQYCTDNAAMIAMAGLFHFEKGDFSPLHISPDPHLELAS